MILHNVKQVVSELNATITHEGSRLGEIKTAQKGLDLISSLQTVDGPEKWIEYGGHLRLVLYHAPPFGIDGKRAIAQVIIDPLHPFAFGEVKYQLPHENRPWEYTTAVANDVSDATAMIVDALQICEQRDEYLYEIPVSFLAEG